VLALLLGPAVAIVIGPVLLLLLLVRRSWPFSCLYLLLRPNRLPGCGVHWRGLGSCVWGAVVGVLVPVHIGPGSSC